MEVALRRRLDGVADISISQREQTAEVTFDSAGHAFSPESFRKAVWEARVVVVSFEVDACGSATEERQQRWLIAGKNRWLLTGDGAVPLEQPVCVSGRLDDRAEPPSLEVVEIQSAPQ